MKDWVYHIEKITIFFFLLHILLINFLYYIQPKYCAISEGDVLKILLYVLHHVSIHHLTIHSNEIQGPDIMTLHGTILWAIMC